LYVPRPIILPVEVTIKFKHKPNAAAQKNTEKIVSFQSRNNQKHLNGISSIASVKSETHNGATQIFMWYFLDRYLKYYYF